jgi:hypothetical protein
MVSRKRESLLLAIQKGFPRRQPADNRKNFNREKSMAALWLEIEALIEYSVVQI